MDRKRAIEIEFGIVAVIVVGSMLYGLYCGVLTLL